jgi:hypothetical protein
VSHLLASIDACREVAAIGNPVLAVRHLLGALPRAGRLEQRVIVGELRALVEEHLAAMASAEHELIATALAQAEWGPLGSELAAIARSLVLTPRESMPVPAGRVNALFVASRRLDGQTFGLVQPVDILLEPEGERVILEHAADDEAVFAGFQQAVWAAQQFLHARAAVPATRASVRGVLPRVPRALPVTGPSIGLAAAIGVISQMLDQPVPAATAFTGRVDPKGGLHAVGGLAAKLAAASDKGMRRVFVPRDNAADVPRGLPALEVIPVTDLAAVVAGVFEALVLASRRASLFVGERARAVVPIGPDRARPRWLLTCVGKADPWGQYLDRSRRGVPREIQEEGPILTLCRVLEPAGVVLLHTAEDGDNDFRDKAESVARVLRASDPDRTVGLAPLTGVADPTEYARLVPAMRAAVQAGLAQAGDAEVYANLSSGSPQMETSWHLLRVTERLPLRLLQVREERFTPAGESRVREVELPVPPR